MSQAGVCPVVCISSTPDSFSWAESVEIPAIPRRCLYCRAWLTRVLCGPLWCVFGPELFGQSQFIIVQLRRLQQTTDLLASLHIRSLGVSLLLLLLDEEELGIVASEFLEGDEEISQVQAELVVLSVECEQTLDKDSDLGTGTKLAMHPGGKELLHTLGGWGRQFARGSQQSC